MFPCEAWILGRLVISIGDLSQLSFRKKNIVEYLSRWGIGGGREGSGNELVNK